MLKKKWFLSIAMLLLLSLVMIACSNGDENNTDNNDAGNQDSGDEQEEVTLKWLVPSIDQPDQDEVWEAFNEELQDYLPNTTVEFENVTIPEYAERWQLVAAGQEDIDIAWSFWSTPFVAEVQKGAYTDLTDLVSEYAPDILEEIDESVLDFGRVDERLYAIPNWQPMADMRVSMRVPLEDFEEFWSEEEAEDVFYAREERPLDQAAYDAMNDFFQKVQDERGSIEVNPHALDQMQQGQVITGPFSIRLQDDNYEVVNKMELPEMKLFFDNMRDWNEKGFIRQDILSNPDGGGNAESAAHFHAYYPGDELVQDPEEPVQHVPLGEDYYISQLVHDSYTVIPSSSKNPERAIQLIELMQTEKGKDLFNFLLWGIEDEHYEKIDENRIETFDYPGEMPANPGSEAPYGLTHYFTGNTLNSWETQANPEDHWEKMGELHDEAWTSPLIGYKPNVEPIRTQLAQMDAITTEYWDTLRFGTSEDYEDLYEQMIKRMNESGAQEIIDELQSQVDEFVEENDL